MSLWKRKWRDRLAGAAVGSATAAVVAGCGSGGGASQSIAADDAGTDSSAVLHRGNGGAGDAAAQDGGATGSDATAPESGTTKAYDGTVGVKCQSNVDCQPAGGPGVNTCSKTLVDPIYPTPVCILQSCDPGNDGLVHFCDGPDVATSPGVCVALSGGAGVCLPVCFFAGDGSAPIGCTGADTCVAYTAVPSSATPSKAVGLGYCFGGCVANADCPTGSSCQTNTGNCVAKVVAPTKAIGQACTSADNGSSTTPAACNCALGSVGTTGYCTQSCIVKSATATCPAGYTCDALLPTQLTGAADASADASVPGFSVQNTQLAGQCLATCGNDGGACPGTSICSTTTAAGPDCLPP